MGKLLTPCDSSCPSVLSSHNCVVLLQNLQICSDEPSQKFVRAKQFFFALQALFYHITMTKPYLPGDFTPGAEFRPGAALQQVRGGGGGGRDTGCITGR